MVETVTCIQHINGLNSFLVETSIFRKCTLSTCTVFLCPCIERLGGILVYPCRSVSICHKLICKQNISLFLLNYLSYKAHIRYKHTSHRYTSACTELPEMGYCWTCFCNMLIDIFSINFRQIEFHCLCTSEVRLQRKYTG